MSSALWVQLVLVVCCAPSFMLSTFVIIWRTYSLHLLTTSGKTTLLVYLRSTLNSFFCCWKIGEVRKAVRQTSTLLFMEVYLFPWRHARVRVHCLNKTSAITARGKDMLAIIRDMNNLYHWFSSYLMVWKSG